MCDATLKQGLQDLGQSLNGICLTLGAVAAMLRAVDADSDTEEANLLAWGAARLTTDVLGTMPTLDATLYRLRQAVDPSPVPTTPHTAQG